MYPSQAALSTNRPSLLGLAAVLGVVVPSILSGALLSLFYPRSAQAQITPDTTLGTESSVVAPNVEVNGQLIDVIGGGTLRSRNLFHSFLDFNVDAGQIVYFAPPDTASNIFSRVTGNNPSNILGVLGVNGPANLYLLNPNGIVFGPNAALDIEGSLALSTANSLTFQGGAEYTAVPSSGDDLLSVNLPLGLQRGAPPTNGSSIINQGYLAVGEDVSLLSQTVALTDGGVIDARGSGGGNISIHAQDVGIFPGSALLAGIGSGEGTPTAQAGDIDIWATGNIFLQAGAIANSVGLPFVPEFLINQGFVETAQGTGGDVSLRANNLTVKDGAIVAATTSGQGNSGALSLNIAEAITLESLDSNVGEGVGTGVNIGAVGNAGDLTIVTSALRLDRAQIGSVTVGRGDAGDVSVRATGTVSITGVVDSTNEEGNSGIFTTVEPGAVGEGGNIRILANVLELLDGGNVDSSTAGRGRAGDISVIASTVLLDGIGTNQVPSAIFSTVSAGGVGDGGNVTVAADSLSIADGAEINTGSFSLFEPGEPPLITNGSSGDIVLNVAGLAELSGGFVRSQLGTGAMGNAGGIALNAGTVLLTEGGVVNANTDSQGSTGLVSVTARESLRIEGAGSGIASQITSNAIASPQGIESNTPVLILTDGGRISSSTAGQGNAGLIAIETADLTIDTGLIDSLTRGAGAPGEIEVQSSNSVLLTGGRILTSIQDGATVPSTALPGSVSIQTRNFRALDGSAVTAEVQLGAQANVAGNIRVSADRIELNNGSEIQAQAAVQDGGNLQIYADSLLFLGQGSSICSSAGTALGGGNGGNISINAPVIVAIPEENSDITANAFEGSGGNVDITTQGIFGLALRDRPSVLSDITVSSELGVSGEVALNSPDTASLENGLVDLPEAPIDTDTLVASSCVAPTAQGSGQLVLTGAGGLPRQSGSSGVAALPTGAIRTFAAPASQVPIETVSIAESNGQNNGQNDGQWDSRVPIAEPQAIYLLETGQLILNRSCS